MATLLSRVLGLSSFIVLFIVSTAFAQSPCPGPIMTEEWRMCNSEWQNICVYGYAFNPELRARCEAQIFRKYSQPPQPPATQSPTTQSEYRIVQRVVDGDTIDLDNGATVRLIGVNTPETKQPEKPVECFGPEASAFTTKMTQGKRVQLFGDPQSAQRDIYNRVLAYVVLEDGTLLNAAIVRFGFGRVETRFPFSRMQEFQELQTQAQRERRGLWGACY